MVQFAKKPGGGFAECTRIFQARLVLLTKYPEKGRHPEGTSQIHSWHIRC
jgi:hypothetical protein